LTGRELGDDRVVIGFQVGDPVALHITDRGVGCEVVERPVGDHEALGGERGGGFALCAAHLRVELHHQAAGILGRAGGGVDPWLERDGRHLLLAAAGQHRPAFDAHGGDLGATGGSIPPSGAHRERPHEPRRGSRDRIVEREPGVDPPDTIDERHVLDAVVHAFQGFPVVGLDHGVDRPFGRSEGLVLVEGSAVLGVPALDEDASHGAYRTRAPRQPCGAGSELPA
jgi:hypothetical protein